MPNAYTASTDVTTLPKAYHKRFLDRLTPKAQMKEYAMMKPLPQNQGTVMYFPRIINSSTTVSAYKGAQGTVVSTEKVQDEQVSTSVETFRNAKALWDITELTALSAYVDAAVDEQADQAANIVDKRIMEQAYGTSANPWGGGFSIQFADIDPGSATYLNISAAGALVGTSKTITTAMTRKWVKIMRSRNVEPLENGNYVLVVHSDTEMAIQADTTWQNAYFYTNPKNPLDGTFGKYGGMTMVRDNNILVSAAGSSGANLYYSILLGKGALGVSELNGGIKTYFKSSGPQDTSNPVNEFMTFGWKVMFAVTRLNISAGLICVTADQ